MGFSNAFIHPQQVSVKVFFDFKKFVFTSTKAQAKHKKNPCYIEEY